MITVYNAMLVILGALLTALLVLFLLPAYRRRIERFTTERIKRALPLSENEIRADKDRVRAEYATEVHKLEMLLDDARTSGARQTVEINRREARIHELELAIDAQKSDVEEHHNARRVLEQTIMDRLPKVEHRLSEARRMLQQRDSEIAALTDTSARQTEAIEQATQINLQLTDEVNRLRATLDTRAARNRDALGDARFDAEVALKSEIEALRARAADQAQLISRLQKSSADGESQSATSALTDEIAHLKAELANAEAKVLERESSRGAVAEAQKALERQVQEALSETAHLKAALQTYKDAEASRADPATDAAPSEGELAALAELSALKAQADEQRKTIEALRAEVAGGNERLARQTQHMRDELKRLAARNQSEATSGETPAAEGARRAPLVDRILRPRVPGEAGGEQRPQALLKAVNGGSDTKAATENETAPGSEPPRRARLLERISSIDKS